MNKRGDDNCRSRLAPREVCPLVFQTAGAALLHSLPRLCPLGGLAGVRPSELGGRCLKRYSVHLQQAAPGLAQACASGT